MTKDYLQALSISRQYFVSGVSQSQFFPFMQLCPFFSILSLTILIFLWAEDGYCETFIYGKIHLSKRPLWVLEGWEGAESFWRVCCSELFRGDHVKSECQTWQPDSNSGFIYLDLASAYK